MSFRQPGHEAHTEPDSVRWQTYVPVEEAIMLEVHMHADDAVRAAEFHAAEWAQAPSASLTVVPATVPEVVELLQDGGIDDELRWQERALCAQTDPEAFFPEKGGSTREAKRVCLGCDVRNECLDYALSADERFGIWGGLSERERRRLRKRAV